MQTNDSRTVLVEREFQHSQDKVWRALTQGHLIEEWLMKNDFEAVVGHRFKLRGDWGVVDGEVLKVEPQTTLAYGWDAMGLTSVVTWTLTAGVNGTHVRMEQAGFRLDQEQAFQGAKYGWQKLFDSLAQVLDGLA